MEEGFEKTYRYLLATRVRAALSLFIYVWFFLTGVYLFFTEPPPSAQGRIGMATAIALFGVGGILLARKQMHLMEKIHLSQSGIHLWGLQGELVAIAWTEIEEVRSRGGWGDFDVRCNTMDKKIRVGRRLVGLDDLRAIIRDKTGK